jgi:hypothetical protein
MSPVVHLGLDHVGVSVADLALAEADFARLGFAVSPRSEHYRKDPSTQESVRLGSANHCAVFEHGYIELIGSSSVAVGAPEPRIGPFSVRPAGHILAISVRDAEEWRSSLAARGVELEEPLVLERPIEWPNHGILRFCNLYPGQRFPEMRLILIQHLTPELLWISEATVHPNTAVALGGITIGVADPVAAASRLAALTDTEPAVHGAAVDMTMRQGRIRFAWRPDLGADEAAVIDCLDVTVRDLEACRALLCDAALPVYDTAEGLEVDSVTTGVRLRFSTT